MRESLSTWPALSVKIELAPWHWRLFRWHFDDVAWYSYLSVEIGPIEVKFMMNEPPFGLEYCAHELLGVVPDWPGY